MNGKNICPCPNPPGGYHRCPADHVAVCRVINGEVFGECYPVSDHVRQMIRDGDPRVLSWLLQKMFFKESRRWSGEYLRTRFEVDFSAGRIFDRETNEQIRFSLPGQHTDPGATGIASSSTVKPPAGIAGPEKMYPKREVEEDRYATQ